MKHAVQRALLVGPCRKCGIYVSLAERLGIARSEAVEGRSMTLTNDLGCRTANNMTMSAT